MISCCMIVKNEIDTLEKCILSVKEKINGICNEIVVVDTGSTDGTRELAVELGCCVYDFEWCNDFAKARNYSLEKAKNDWIITMDGDEYIGEVDLEWLKEFVVSNNNNRLIGEGTIINYSDTKMQSYTTSIKLMIFNKREVVYKYIIHEIPVMRDGSERKYITLPIEVCHTGYIEEVVKNKNKLERNLELITKSMEDDNDDLYLVMHLGKTYIGLERYDEAVENLKKVLESEKAIKYTFYTDATKEYIRCCIKANMFDEALTCERYWDRCKADDGYVYFMGHAYFKNGQFEKAMDCFVSIASKEYSSVNKYEAVYSLGQMFSVLGFHEESANYYEMCGDFSDAKEQAKAERGMIV